MVKETFHGPLERVDDCCWRIPKSYKHGMRVDGLIFADEHLLDQVKKDQAPEQVANVAFLPGIQHASLAMPDIHWGYGFCIGGVCATDPDEGGVISPGGVGYDINCGVRLMRSNLYYRDVKHQLRPLIDTLFRNIPTGVGKSGRYEFRGKELERLLTEGSPYLVSRGLAEKRDIEYTEAHGRLDGADPDAVSDHAKKRGAEQCGTLGSGNHFLEVQVVDCIFDEEAAAVMGLAKDMVCVMIHSGSRGLGYQVCDDALAMLRKAPEKYGIDLPDRQLACAPVNSPEGQKYIAAMRAA
ncbi:MAG TPA: RtcB family protein, partial [Gemmataceae bacterium]|nr:RtcB family protein [Gemmataceae bacterium]